MPATRLIYILLVLILILCGAAALVFVPRGVRVNHLAAATSAEAATPAAERTLAAHSGVVRSVAFSPDGNVLASSGDDETVRLWNVSDGKALQSMSMPGGPVTAVAFSANGKWIAAGQYNRNATSISVHSYADGRIGPLVRTLKDPHNLVSHIAFSGDSTVLIASVGYTVDLWDADTGEQKARLDAGANASGAISPDGKTVITGSTNENALIIWSAEDGTQTGSWMGHDAGPISIDYSTAGDRVASGGYDSKILVWDASTGNAAISLPVPDADIVEDIRFSPDASRVFGALPHRVLQWNTRTGVVERSVAFEAAHALAVSPDGGWLAIGGEQGSIQIVRLSSARSATARP